MIQNKFKTHTLDLKKFSVCSLFHVLQNTITEKALYVGISRTIKVQLLQILYFVIIRQYTYP